MAVKFETLKAGDVLYDVHRARDAFKTLSWWRVVIKETPKPHDKTVLASWNGNPARLMARRNAEGLRRSIPKKLAGPSGNVRP